LRVEGSAAVRFAPDGSGFDILRLAEKYATEELAGNLKKKR